MTRILVMYNQKQIEIHIYTILEYIIIPNIKIMSSSIYHKYMFYLIVNILIISLIFICKCLFSKYYSQNNFVIII